MALDVQRAVEAAAECKAVCDDLKAAHQRARAFLTANSNLSIDWTGDPLPDYLIEAVPSGNIDTFRFSRAQVANAIGSIDQFRALMENGAVSQGDHLGNINQVADVEV
jgi:hypothetical protein